MKQTEPDVIHRRIGGVKNPLEAEYLWEAAGAEGTANRELLGDLLRRHPRRKARVDRPHQLFGHVVLYLPAAVVDRDDRHSGGAGVRELCERLEVVHTRLYGRYLVPGEGARYQVRVGAGLADDEVEVQFGHAIRLPQPGEAPRFRLLLSTDSQDWWHQCDIHPGQRQTLLNGSRYGSTSSVADWPFDDGVSLVLIQEDTPPALRLSAVPLEALSLDGDGDEYPWAVTDDRDNWLFLRVQSVDRAPAAEVPFRQAPEPRPQPEEASRVDAPPGSEPGRSSTVTVAVAPDRWETGEEDECTLHADGRLPGLSVVALAIQALSRYREYRLAALRLGFDTGGALVDPDDPRAVAVLAADAEDRLVAETPAGRSLLEPPVFWEPAPGIRLQITAPPSRLERHYLGFLQLNRPHPLPLLPGRALTLGRGPRADLSLRLFDSARLATLDRALPAPGAESLGNSRAAAQVTALPGGVAVRAAEGNKLVHLDTLCVPLEVVPAGTTAVIPPGHHLVSGGYVLRCVV